MNGSMQSDHSKKYLFWHHLSIKAYGSSSSPILSFRIIDIYFNPSTSASSTEARGLPSPHCVLLERRGVRPMVEALPFLHTLITALCFGCRPFTRLANTRGGRMSALHSCHRIRRYEPVWKYFSFSTVIMTREMRGDAKIHVEEVRAE